MIYTLVQVMPNPLVMFPSADTTGSQTDKQSNIGITQCTDTLPEKKNHNNSLLVVVGKSKATERQGNKCLIQIY